MTKHIKDATATDCTNEILYLASKIVFAFMANHKNLDFLLKHFDNFDSMQQITFLKSPLP